MSDTINVAAVKPTSMATLLFTPQQIATLHANHQRHYAEGHDPMPVVHLAVPGHEHHWLLSEIDDDIAFGLCDLGMGFPELGYVDLNEIVDATSSFGIPLVNDPDFRATAPLSVYAHHARQARRIVLDWDDMPPSGTTPAVASEGGEPLGDDATTVALPSAEDEKPEDDEHVMPLAQFLTDFSTPLLEQISKQTPVLYDGTHAPWQDEVLAGLTRQPFAAQKHRIHACYAGLVTHGLPAVVLNGEMGTGKTLMGICVSALMQHEYSRKPVLVISPPHLVYKWRREILDTVPDAVVTVINGSNAIRELQLFRKRLRDITQSDRPHYLVIGRVRMRMGFYWRPSYWTRPYRFMATLSDGKQRLESYPAIACQHCGSYCTDSEGRPLHAGGSWGKERREHCKNCGAALWTMRHQDNGEQTPEERLRKFLGSLPGIGAVTTTRLLDTFGTETLETVIDDNIFDFVNLQTADGGFFFNDRQAERLEKALGRQEFALRNVSYQPSEFVKRFFPRKGFSLALVDEAHEYKNAGSAQGQAMAVLCDRADKVLCLTGTLMGGYASDLFYLLFRAMPGVMTRLGFGVAKNNSLAASETNFMRHYGCLIDIVHLNQEGESFQTSRGKKATTASRKAPGFAPLGIARFVLPYTVFMRLADLGEGILPEFEETTRMIEMPVWMADANRSLTQQLQTALREALARRDNSLTGVVINALLRWPETCFRDEKVVHPHDKQDLLAQQAALYDADTPTPKEADVIELCLAEKALGRRVIVYTTYTGGHDTSTRLRNLLQAHGLSVAVLRSTVGSDAREDWINDQVERGIDVLITNPELVKTGLDLLAFPTIYFAQTGYNVYTVTQASRRSWRIGQKEAVKVYYACYAGSAQVQCMELMARKIKTALSTMGVMPETGLDAFVEEGEGENSITEALAKQLLGRA